MTRFVCSIAMLTFVILAGCESWPNSASADTASPPSAPEATPPVAQEPPSAEPPAPEVPAAPVLIGPDIPALNAAAATLLQAAHVPGLAACIVRGADIVWCRGYGHANLETGEKATAHTPFMLASVSKLFVATAAVQLADRGILDLDAPIDSGLDFAVAHPTGAPITARALLAHAGGVQDADSMDAWYSYGGNPTVALSDAMRGYFAEGGQWYDPAANFLAGAPQTQTEYSNAGYALLGHALEPAAGVDFTELTRQEIFEPLGMSSATWRLPTANESKPAMPYQWVGGHYEETGYYTFADYPNGGLFCSAADLARFVAAYASGAQNLVEGGADRMYAPVFPDLDPSQGTGWGVFPVGDEQWVGHSGGEDGVATDVLIRPSDGLGLVVLMNGDWPDQEDPVLDFEDALIQAATKIK